MSQKKSRKEYRHLDGILLFDKPKGISSNRALQQIRHLFAAKKAGHTGTLDPMATGLLPICFGEATKFSGQLLNNHKEYQFTCRLGIKTDSGDAEGTIIEKAPIPPLTQQRLESLFQQFLGPIEQIPPMYSALHHNGERLYQLARKGVEVERKARKITLFSLTLDHFDELHFTATVRCSKGTYVRVLAEDLAQILGSVGHLTMLRRISITPFERPQMVTLSELEAQGEGADLDHLLQPIDQAVVDLPKLLFSQEESQRLLYGQRIPIQHPLTEEQYRLYCDDGTFLGIGAPHNGTSIGAKRLIKTN